MEEAKVIAPNITILPPAKRGDFVFPSDSIRPKIIVLIDGAFLNTLTVSPREILNLLKQGIKVIGASSLGAIRATELRSFGMIGVGRVFEMYRDEIIIADDEVAMSMDPITGSAMSEPLVHFRIIIEKAKEIGLLNVKDSEELFHKIQQLYFTERTLAMFYQFASDCLSIEKYNSLLNMIENFDYRIKRLDAIKAIEKAYEIVNEEKRENVNT
nr:TfuA-like protein [Bacillus sp. SM2101]